MTVRLCKQCAEAIAVAMMPRHPLADGHGGAETASAVTTLGARAQTSPNTGQPSTAHRS